MKANLLLFRRDLRLDDNTALNAARAQGGPLLCLFVLQEDEVWPLGGASRWWLHHSLKALAASLKTKGLELIVRRGNLSEEVLSMVKEFGIGAVFSNRVYEPRILLSDRLLEQQLEQEGVAWFSFTGYLLFEPSEVRNKQGGPYQVFTPFWRHCLTLPLQEPQSFDVTVSPRLEATPTSLDLGSLGLLPRKGWAEGFGLAWLPGEEGAKALLRRFIGKGVVAYEQERDIPSLDGSSRLSPHLHWGEISPRRVMQVLRKGSIETGVFPANRGEARFVAELGWREFAAHLLFHFPDTDRAPLRPAYAQFPWAKDPSGLSLKAWSRGLTGYPIVDAGMRQLWSTGWMHNRVRMIVASFLVKHLRLPWQAGARWFWDTLLDADLASNTLGWQWSAGCGADAVPYFRIFNPVLQGEKFDAEGHYVRRWVPELGRLPDKYIHKPWQAPTGVLRAAGLELGQNYPLPMVDHASARAAALEALSSLKQ